MDRPQAERLSHLEQEEPERACKELRDSGYGTLADEGQDSRTAFEEYVAVQQGPLSKDGLKAYAKMKMCKASRTWGVNGSQSRRGAGRHTKCGGPNITAAHVVAIVPIKVADLRASGTL
jgi:hypothetical protein